MIIFDLDGVLANCEHRRHFVDVTKNDNYTSFLRGIDDKQSGYDGYHKKNNLVWKPNWKAFFEACDKDEPIKPVIETIRSLHGYDYYAKSEDVHIWSGRSESVRLKTEQWLNAHGVTYVKLKMRPVGDSTPDDVLKEKWLDEALSEGKEIDFVFDDRPKVIRMWRKRGIFVFKCAQNDEEF